MSDDGEETLLEFPTPFAVKIMGRNEEGFVDYAKGLVTAHTSGAEPLSVAARESRNGRFLSVTVEITAQSKAQLDAIYQTLSDDERVVMAL